MVPRPKAPDSVRSPHEEEVVPDGSGADLEPESELSPQDGAAIAVGEVPNSKVCDSGSPFGLTNSAMPCNEGAGLQSSTSPKSSLGSGAAPSDSRGTVDGGVPCAERLKSLGALVFVFGGFAVLTLGLIKASEGFVSPVCDAEAPAERSCEPCGTGTSFLPILGEWEKSWPRWIRVVLYFVGLIWAFMGVGIVCDQFMAAIEEITSAEKIVWTEVHSGTRRKFHVKMWNATIANLSLMALGSSAPEILLSATELAANDFFAGKLGPSTIVGSAAFNLLVITAVCVSAIPAPQVRTIEGTGVFCVTTAVSVFAYLWLLVILLANTPDKVELWESSLTLGMFPLLLVVAFAADKGWLFKPFRVAMRPHQEQLEQKESDMEARERQIQARFGKELPPPALRLMLEAEIASERSNVSKAQIRKNITRSFTAGSKLSKTGSNLEDLQARGTNAKSLIFGFKEERHVVLECAGTLTLKVVASRDPGAQVDIRYYTREGTAKRDMRYKHVEGILSFGARQREASICVPIIDNNNWDPDEEFYVVLDDDLGPDDRNSNKRRRASGASARSSFCSRTSRSLPEFKLGQQCATVTVLNDDLPGVLSFDADEVQTTEGSVATIGVIRTGGCTGRIECKYQTQDDTAVADKDYQPVSGTLVFEDGESHRTVEVPIMVSHDHEMEASESFRLILTEASPGVKFDPNSDGGEAQAICDIIIQADQKASCCGSVARRLFNLDRDRVGLEQWAEQCIAALYCNGSPEDQAEASALDWFFHIVTLFWKLLFAVVPPPIFMGGWACFFSALFMIGAVTAFVGEIASLLGCSIGMADEVTAITLVALGTSLPDTFASKAAAQQEETADNSIGNIMGSNSVNVFLGLGISWTVGAAYWHMQGVTQAWLSWRHHGQSYRELFVDTGKYPGGGFMVPAGALLFSVCIYTICAVCCIALLIYRRQKYGGELGGPQMAQYRDSAILFMLWVFYVIASAVYASVAN